jgi:hypothetical protein
LPADARHERREALPLLGLAEPARFRVSIRRDAVLRYFAVGNCALALIERRRWHDGLRDHPRGTLTVWIDRR